MSRNISVACTIIIAFTTLTNAATEGDPQATAQAGLTLIKDGNPVSVIVTSDAPLPSQRIAAKELQYHLQKMTGALVPIVNERDFNASDVVPIFVGQSEALQARGIDTTTLPRETMIVETLDDALVLAGEDGSAVTPYPDDYNSADVRTGTMYAVYDFLGDQLGCRWLWPGESGEAIPQRDTITVSYLDIQETPVMFQRLMRPGALPRMKANDRDKPSMSLYFPRNLRLHEAAFDRSGEEEALWLKRMRLGESLRLAYGHAFTKWYDKYHDTIPEVFAMQADGQRGLPDPTYNHAFVKMCPSSDKLIDMLIEQFLAERAGNPEHRFLNACENDGNGGFCQCPDCKAIDLSAADITEEQATSMGWSGADVGMLFAEKSDGLPYSLSNRYFAFYNRLARRLREVAPDASVVVYAYDRYKFAPVGMEIEPNILVALIGFNMYPVTKEAQQLQIDNATAWRKAGATQITFRPNSFCFGPIMGMPWSQARQMGDDFRVLIDSGIVATDWDRLNGFWAMVAPTYYILARMHWDTQTDPEPLLQEFAEAFGPAGPAVARYFDYWEQLMTDTFTRSDLVEVIGRYDPKAGRRGRNRGIHRLITQADFDEARTILNEARRLAEGSDDPSLVRKIEVFEMGLRHGELVLQQAEFGNDVMQPDRDTWFAGHWAAAKEMFDIRHRMLHAGVFNSFWYTTWSMQHNDFYHERAAFDFEARPFAPVMTPAANTWRFAPDPQDQGEGEKWFVQPELPGAMQLNMNSLDEPWDGMRSVKRWKVDNGHEAVLHGWYQVRFDLGQHPVPADAVLYIPYIHGSAKLWIDDQLVQEFTSQQGASDIAMTIPLSALPQGGDASFTATLKITSPDRPGGLLGPLYIAQPVE